MIAPCVAILSDRVPKYRGSMSAFYGARTDRRPVHRHHHRIRIHRRAEDRLQVGTICWCLCGIGTVLLLPRELSAAPDTTERFDIKQVAMQFRPPTKGARDFYLALIGRLMLIFGYNAIVGYQLYVCMKLRTGCQGRRGDRHTMAVISMIVSLVRILGFGQSPCRTEAQTAGVRLLRHHRHRHRRAVGPESQFSMFAYAALAGLERHHMAVDRALNVDVLPNPDEAGKDLGILNLASTLGPVIAPIVVSSIVVATGGS